MKKVKTKLINGSIIYCFCSCSQNKLAVNYCYFVRKCNYPVDTSNVFKTGGIFHFRDSRLEGYLVCTGLCNHSESWTQYIVQQLICCSWFERSYRRPSSFCCLQWCGGGGGAPARYWRVIVVDHMSTSQLKTWSTARPQQILLFVGGNERAADAQRSGSCRIKEKEE